MPDLDRLVIPTSLLPSDGRFGSGPSKVRPEALRRLAEAGAPLMGTSHRQPPIRGLVQQLQEGIAELFHLPDGYEVVLGVGGASALWDAAAFGLIERRSRHYVFGEFSGKFAAAVAAAPWLDEPLRVGSDPGTRPALVGDDEADVQALTHNETSTGVMMDLARPDGAIVLVDATSGAGGLPVEVADTDWYYFSLQKGFAADGGLWVALASPTALRRIADLREQRYVPGFLDLAAAVDNSRQRQTVNTPAIATLLLAVDQVRWLLDGGGLEASVAACRAKADHLYGWAEEAAYARPFVDEPAARSLVVGTVDLEGVSSDDVTRVLRANGIVDTEPYRKLGRNQLRVAMFPAVDLGDVRAYTACVDWVVERLAA